MSQVCLPDVLKTLYALVDEADKSVTTTLDIIGQLTNVHGIGITEYQQEIKTAIFDHLRKRREEEEAANEAASPRAVVSNIRIRVSANNTVKIRRECTAAQMESPSEILFSATDFITLVTLIDSTNPNVCESFELSSGKTIAVLKTPTFVGLGLKNNEPLRDIFPYAVHISIRLKPFRRVSKRIVTALRRKGPVDTNSQTDAETAEATETAIHEHGLANEATTFEDTKTEHAQSAPTLEMRTERAQSAPTLEMRRHQLKEGQRIPDRPLSATAPVTALGKRRSDVSTYSNRFEEPKASRHEDEEFSMILGNSAFLTISKFRGRKRVDLRRFFRSSRDDTVHPVHNGLSLDKEQFESLLDHCDEIKKAVEESDFTFSFCITDTRRVTVSRFSGRSLVDLREYHHTDGEWIPGKRGLSFDVSALDALSERADEIMRHLE